MLVVVVADGVVVGVTDAVRLADELTVVDSLLEALQPSLFAHSGNGTPRTSATALAAFISLY